MAGRVVNVGFSGTYTDMLVVIWRAALVASEPVAKISPAALKSP
jgi:hypothetical protein